MGVAKKEAALRSERREPREIARRRLAAAAAAMCFIAACGDEGESGRYVDPAQAGAMPLDAASALAEGEGSLHASSDLSDPIVSVGGITSASNPPDTVLDVGPGHVVQMVNATQYQIFDKNGAALTGALTFGDLWPLGDTCNSNAGDPIVVYDHLADRWLLSQFAFPNHMCIAISQTPDPTAGTWFVYTIDTGVFPDYPKFGVWPDGYYMSSYEGSLLGIYAFDRAAMLTGGPATFLKTTLPSLGAPGVRDTRILPSDLDGPAPPAGTPNIFVRTVDDQQDPANPTDRIEVYTAAANFTTSTLTFTLVNSLTPTAFDTMLCNRNGQGIRDCIPQPDETDTVDALSNRPMMQLKYRNFGAHEALVFNQTIDVSDAIPFAANEVAGIRFYELRRSGAGFSIFQEGTFAPQPANATTEAELLHRWMGSAAMDRKGNIALGYSVVNSNSTDGQEVFPGIRYAGRRFDDPLGTLDQGEKTILNGTNSQGDGDASVEPQRWGDYSALSVDPTDDCTFWYTTHVAGAGGTGARPTQIASFRFDHCNEPPVAKCKDVEVAADDMCTASVSPSDVDAGSFDPDGDAFTCALSATGPFGLGATVVTLTCTDAFGAASSCAATVAVVDKTPPMFTFVPPAKTISDCSEPNIGQAKAKDNCGPVCVTNDAPKKFPLGSTTVTWTATDGSGNTATASQTVTAVLKDDPSCCPSGSKIIVGTAYGDTLHGTNGCDCILGRGGDDIIKGLKGNDFISAGAGNDKVDTGKGSDHVDGGSGTDQCVVPNDGMDVKISCEK